MDFAKSLDDTWILWDYYGHNVTVISDKNIGEPQIVDSDHPATLLLHTDNEIR